MSRYSPTPLRELRPLSELVEPFTGFARARGKQTQIHAVLSKLARRERAHGPARFFSMTEVKAHFGVALRTVEAVYRRLEQDGLVVRIRGSQTQLTARQGIAPRVAVRGVVALVNWLPGFVHTPDQRFVVMQMEKDLWDKGFVSEIVFYHEEDKSDPGFARRILAHRPNVVIWLMPGPADEATLASIGDVGVRLAVIANQPVRTRTPQYTISWLKAYEAAMRGWRRNGVTHVAIPAPDWRTYAMRPELAEILTQCGLTFQHYPIGARELMDDYVERLAAQPGGVLFDFDIWHARLCTQAPRAFARLLARRPVLQSWPLPIERALLAGIRTDVLIMPWREIITRMVVDLSSGRMARMRANVGFEAAWRHHVDAAALSRLHAYERV